jgi:hypothetical protein
MPRSFGIPLQLTILLLVLKAGQALWPQRINQPARPVEVLGLYSQIGNRGTNVLSPIPLTSSVFIEQAAIDFTDGTNLKLSSEFEVKGDGRDSFGLIGKLIARARKTIEAPFLEKPSGLEVSSRLHFHFLNILTTFRC